MNRAQEKEALLWGLVGVTLFAATLPMTRLAVGSTDAPQLSPGSSRSGVPPWRACCRLATCCGSARKDA